MRELSTAQRSEFEPLCLKMTLLMYALFELEIVIAFNGFIRLNLSDLDFAGSGGDTIS